MPLLNIFISHKHEDNPAAVTVRDTLSKYGGNQIQVFVSSDIPAGADWFDCIRKQLIASNLLLLFTDKKLSWDWCLYEAGMFTRLDGDSHRRVICLHSPDLTPPEPLKHLQAVPANTNEIVKFLSTLYRSNTYTQVDEPINSHIKDDELRRAASDISAYMIKKPRDVQHFSKHITLHIRNPHDIAPNVIPPDATVIADEATLDIFDKLQGKWIWKDIETEARKNLDQRWLNELAKCIYRASQKSPVDAMFATFNARRGCKVYQPVLYRAEWEQDGSVNFKILFHEETSWRLSDIPDSIAVLQTAQNMALRFRYEVLQKYLKLLPHDLEQVTVELRDSIHNIEQEAASRGLLEQGKLTNVFEATNDRNVMAAMYQDWYAVRRFMDEALIKGQWDDVRECLLKMRHYNNQFIPLAARRYEQLMNQTVANEADVSLVNGSSGMIRKKHSSPPSRRRNGFKKRKTIGKGMAKA